MPCGGGSLVTGASWQHPGLRPPEPLAEHTCPGTGSSLLAISTDPGPQPGTAPSASKQGVACDSALANVTPAEITQQLLGRDFPRGLFSCQAIVKTIPGASTSTLDREACGDQKPCWVGRAQAPAATRQLLPAPARLAPGLSKHRLLSVKLSCFSQLIKSQITEAEAGRCVGLSAGRSFHLSPAPPCHSRVATEALGCPWPLCARGTRRAHGGRQVCRRPSPGWTADTAPLAASRLTWGTSPTAPHPGELRALLAEAGLCPPRGRGKVPGVPWSLCPGRRTKPVLGRSLHSTSPLSRGHGRGGSCAKAGE